jgi:hypothetical protein
MIRVERTRGARALQALFVASLVLGAGDAAAQGTAPANPPAAAGAASPAKAPQGKGAKDAKDPKKDEKPAETESETAATAKVNATENDGKAEEPEKESARAIYFSFDGGFARPDLGGFSNSLSFDKTSANGVTWSVGTGVRLKDIKLGARWRAFDTTEFDLWSVMLEAGYALPLRPVSPGISAHVGYIWDQKLQRPLFASSLPGSRQTVLDPSIDVTGVMVGAEVQAMYWLNKYIRAGGFVGFDMLFLNRSQASLPGTTSPVPEEIRVKPLYTDSGSGVGYVFSIGLRGAFDIGF